MIRRAKFYDEDHIQEKHLTEQPREKRQQKLTRNISYHPAFQNVKEILKYLHILVTFDNTYPELVKA